VIRAKAAIAAGGENKDSAEHIPARRDSAGGIAM